MAKIPITLLHKEISKSIVLLAGKTPLYSIRLEDVTNDLNERLGLADKQRILSGSVLNAMARAFDSSLHEIDQNLARRLKELSQEFLHTNLKDPEIKRHGRYRRFCFFAWFLGNKYVWQEIKPMYIFLDSKMDSILKLQLMVSYFFSLVMPSQEKQTEYSEGIKEILVVESTMPVGYKKDLAGETKCWIEPLNPYLVKFLKLLDGLIAELQQEKIFDPKLHCQAIRQSVWGMMIGLAMGQIIYERQPDVKKKYLYSAQKAEETIKIACSSYGLQPLNGWKIEK